MTYNILTPLIGAQPIAEKSTTQKHILGTEVQAYDSTYGVGTFRYMKGVASTAIGSWVSYDSANVTTLTVADAANPLAVAMVANTTTGSYAWYQIAGNAVALGLTSITATTIFLFLTSTGGKVDDATVAGDAVYNARKTATAHVVGTFLDVYMIDRPFCTNRVSAEN